MSGDLFSRSAMKRKARKAPEDGGDGLADCPGCDRRDRPKLWWVKIRY